MRTLLLLAFAAATPAWAQQKALPVDADPFFRELALRHGENG